MSRHESSDSNIFLLLGIALLLGGGGYAVYEMTRGIRNNNPGNLRYSPANDWLGQTGSDGSYAVFSNPVYGIRALAKTILNYVNIDGVHPSITGIISRWAPPNENSTANYIADVSARVGVNPNAPLNIPSYLTQIVAAIIHHENSIQPYDTNTLNQSVSMALSS